MSAPGSNGERIASIRAAAQQLFGRPPEFIVRAPGRVNLLGEHTDYNHLPVLPIAIDRDVLVAGAARRDRSIVLHNAAAAFPPRSYELVDPIPAFAAGDWGNYPKAAAQGLLHHCGERLATGADLYVDGNIPAGAGLSSSSALVVASALALLAANDVELPYPSLAEVLPTAEQYVGTLSGGMDQAISLLAQAGHALRIDFAPLQVRTVPLPPDHVVVVCHSLVRADKSGNAREAYNRRVIECRLACRILQDALGTAEDPAFSLGEITRRFRQRSLPSLVEVLRARVDAPLSLAAAASLLRTSSRQLQSDLAIPAGISGPFDVVRRARHVLSEAGRVERAEERLRAGDAAGFGRLMDASHASCRDDYEVSCAALDELVTVAKQAGALGARLTGAGFGGCTVNLVRAADVTGFVNAIDEGFYRSRLTGTQQPEEWRFIFTAQRGAQVLRLT
jgi:N-acetylgalactosamine kinase